MLVSGYVSVLLAFHLSVLVAASISTDPGPLAKRFSSIVDAVAGLFSDVKRGNIALFSMRHFEPKVGPCLLAHLVRIQGHSQSNFGRRLRLDLTKRSSR